jgi:hypothetical protein
VQHCGCCCLLYTRGLSWVVVAALDVPLSHNPMGALRADSRAVLTAVRRVFLPCGVLCCAACVKRRVAWQQ